MLCAGKCKEGELEKVHILSHHAACCWSYIGSSRVLILIVAWRRPEWRI